MFDIVTVVHNDINSILVRKLFDSVYQYMTHSCDFYIEDNKENNLGFAKACNNGAAKGVNPIIGFLNPDALVVGNFMDPVINVFDSDPSIMITGGNFYKPQVEVVNWGVNDWVCGAAMFVRREFWEHVGGFDEQFIWSFEETDLIRTCEKMGMKCKSLTPEELPIVHSSPVENSQEDLDYKGFWFAECSRRFYEKWSS